MTITEIITGRFSTDQSGVFVHVFGRLISENNGAKRYYESSRTS